MAKVKKQRNRKGDAKTRLLDLQRAVNHQSSFKTSRSEGREEEEDTKILTKTRQRSQYLCYRVVHREHT